MAIHPLEAIIFRSNLLKVTQLNWGKTILSAINDPLFQAHRLSWVVDKGPKPDTEMPELEPLRTILYGLRKILTI